MVIVPPSITPLPPSPDPNDRATFNVRAYPWAAAQGVLATEVAAVSVNVYENAQSAASAAQDAEWSRDAAAAAANFKGAWSALSGALAVPSSASHGGSVWILTEPVADVAGHEPGVSGVWMVLSPLRRLSILSAGAASLSPVSGLEFIENENPSLPVSISGIVWSGANFVADLVASGPAVYTSPDGVTWTGRTMPSAGVWKVCSAGGGVLIACAQGGTAVAKSTDHGVTWSLLTTIPSAATASAVPVLAEGSVWFPTVDGQMRVINGLGFSSSSATTIPQALSGGRFYGVGGHLLWWVGGTSCRLSGPNWNMGTWPGATLPFTPSGDFHATHDMDGSLIASLKTQGSPIYRTTDGVTWTNTGRTYGELACVINGVETVLGPALGGAATRHAGVLMLRRTYADFAGPDYTKRGAWSGSVAVLPSSLANRVTRIAPAEGNAGTAVFM